MDPWSEAGRARYREAVGLLESLVDHAWLREAVGRGRVRLLDLCSGTGIGGVALARVLLGRGARVELTAVDLRGEDLEKARRFAREELGLEISTAEVDAVDVHSLGGEFDVALLYGHSTPHFDAWDLVRLAASVAESLSRDGLFVVQEQDRVEGILRPGRYERLLAEDVGPGRLLVTAHLGYDHLRGSYRRAAVDLLSGRGPAIHHVRFWDLAGLMAILWTEFEDVDFSPTPGRRLSGFVLAARPRDVRVRPGDLGIPRVLRQSDSR